MGDKGDVERRGAVSVVADGGGEYVADGGGGEEGHVAVFGGGRVCGMEPKALEGSIECVGVLVEGGKGPVGRGGHGERWVFVAKVL